MQFICVKCSRTEEVIGDACPSCLGCGEPLLKATKSYDGLLMSPEFVLKRMKTLVQKHGLPRVESGPFKHEREAWSTAIYALALSEMYSKKYWVRVETVAQTPDTYVHHIDQSTGSNIDQTQSVEVVDWVETVADVMTLIEKKAKKAYPPFYCLLITGRSGKALDPHAIAEEIEKISIPFAEIWIVGMLAYNVANAARLFPSLSLLQFDIRTALQKAKTENDIMVKQKRGKGTQFTPLGPIYLPIP